MAFFVQTESMLLLGNPQSPERNLLQGKKTKKPLASPGLREWKLYSDYVQMTQAHDWTIL